MLLSDGITSTPPCLARYGLFVSSLLTELGQDWLSGSVFRTLVPLSAPQLPPNCDGAVLVPTLKDKLKLASVVELRQRTLVALGSSGWDPVGLGGAGHVFDWSVLLLSLHRGHE